MTGPATLHSPSARALGAGTGDAGATFGVMASTGEVRVVGLPQAVARDAIEGAIAETRRIEAKYSRYRADSVVSRINALAGSGATVDVDAETAGLLDFADRMFEHSSGCFDITSGVLRAAWDFRSGRLPSADEIRALLPRIGWRRTGWRQGARSIRLPAGMELDFGGFGKEYAVDRAAAVLVEAGATGGFVNLGGDVRVIGPNALGAAWQIGIRHPRKPDAALVSVSITRGGLATSGDYERFMEVGGRRYCHILDPRTGWPVQSWQSVSVVAPVCLAAGALTTSAMLAGDSAEEFLRAQGARYVAVSADGRVARGGL